MTAQAVYLIVAAIAVGLIAMQLVTQQVNVRRLWVVPAAAALFGLQGLAHTPPESPLVAGLLVLNMAVAAILGATRGGTYRVFVDGAGVSMMRATGGTLGLWAVTIAARFALNLAFPGAVPMAELPLVLSATLAAQNLVIWHRAGHPQPAPREAR